MAVNDIYLGKNLTQHISKICGQAVGGQTTYDTNAVRIGHHIYTSIKIGSFDVLGKIDKVLDFLAYHALKGAGGIFFDRLFP